MAAAIVPIVRELMMPSTLGFYVMFVLFIILAVIFAFVVGMADFPSGPGPAD